MSNENVFARIIDRQIDAHLATSLSAFVASFKDVLKEAISTDIRAFLMDGTAPSGPKPAKARLPKATRKPKATVDTETVEAVVYLVGQHTEGAPTSVLATEANLPKAITAKALAYALDAGTIRKTGNKRSTLYFANAAAAE